MNKIVSDFIGRGAQVGFFVFMLMLMMSNGFIDAMVNTFGVMVPYVFVLCVWGFFDFSREIM